MPLSDRIAEAIEGSNKTKADIARACGVTNAAVTHWLSGGTLSLKAETALALGEATGYRAQWILSGRGTKKMADAYWPFSIAIERFERLSDRDKGYVEARLEAAIEECLTRTNSANRNVERAKQAIETLNEEERLDLLTAIMQPGLPDHVVEERIPATKRQPSAKDLRLMEESLIPKRQRKVPLKKSA